MLARLVRLVRLVRVVRLLAVRAIVLGALAAAAALVGCYHHDATTFGESGNKVNVSGVGATFPAPLYEEWTKQYANVAPSVRVGYEAKGSGAGLKAMTEKTADFGATDDPPAEDTALLQLPMALSGVVVAYRFKGATSRLVLTPEVLDAIYTGSIVSWDDKAIRDLNPDVALPQLPITPVYREGDSGSSKVFTQYIAESIPNGRMKPTGLFVPLAQRKLPAGKTADVLAALATRDGAIGYLDYSVALQKKLPTAMLRNKAGRFVDATLDAIGSAATALAAKDLRASIVNAPGEGSYPMATFSYVLVGRDVKDLEKGVALARFLWWAAHEGQRFGPALGYVPIPEDMVIRVESILRTVTAGGQRALTGS